MLILNILILIDLLNSVIIFVIGMLFWVLFYFNGRKKYNHEFAIIRMLILSIPLSFTNIFGSPYATMAISWFNIFFIIIIITYFLKYVITNKAYLNFMSMLSAFILVVSLLPVLRANNSFAALKQYINLAVSFLLLIIGNSFKREVTQPQLDILKFDYIISTIITAIGIIIQIIFVQILKIEVGNYKFFGGYRHAYGYLFADYSFLSLYLVSGAMMLYFYDKNIKKIRLIYVVFLLITSILTSARTGIVSFIVIFIIWSILNVLNLLMKKSPKGFTIIVGDIILFSVSYLLVSKTRNIHMFSDSGRRKLNSKAFNIFLENPYLGIGFGTTNYKGMLPHNLFFQSLSQGGLVYTIPLLIFLVVLLWEAYKKDISMLPVLAVVLFGSLFIPNIFNSRFFPVLMMLLSMAI